MIEFAVTAGMLSWVALTDIKKRIIPNVAVGLGLLIGLIIHVNNLRFSIDGIIFCSFPLMILWVLGVVGAGDVKLAGALGALVGSSAGLEIIVYAIILSFVWVLVTSIISGQFMYFITENIRGLKMFFTGRFKEFVGEHKKKPGLPLGAF